MPRLSVWFLRASLLYFLVGVTFGALMLANNGLNMLPTIWVVFPAHMEFLLVGWLLQLAMGVAFWILPRFAKGAPRGPETLLWGSFWLLNLGIFVVAYQTIVTVSWLSIVGRMLESGGVALFLIGCWPRVKPVGG